MHMITTTPCPAAATKTTDLKNMLLLEVHGSTSREVQPHILYNLLSKLIFGPEETVTSGRIIHCAGCTMGGDPVDGGPPISCHIFTRYLTFERS